MSRTPASASIPTNVCFNIRATQEPGRVDEQGNVTMPPPQIEIDGLNQLSDGLRRLSDFMRGQVARPISQTTVTRGIGQDLDLGARPVRTEESPDSGLIRWDYLYLNRPDGEGLVPNWIGNWEPDSQKGTTEIQFTAGGLYQLSWSLLWTAQGSTQDQARTYPSMRTISDSKRYYSSAASFGEEDTSITHSLVYPARCFDIQADDKIGIWIERVAGNSTLNWTLQTPSFLCITKL